MDRLEEIEAKLNAIDSAKNPAKAIDALLATFPEDYLWLIDELHKARKEASKSQAELAVYREVEQAGTMIKLPYLAGDRIYVLCDYVARGYRTTTMSMYHITHRNGKPTISFQCSACSHYYSLEDVFPTLKEVRAALEVRNAKKQKDREEMQARCKKEHAGLVASEKEDS